MPAPQKIIAVVGLSDKKDRPSYGVAAYLHQQGYRVIGVSPTIAGQMMFDHICYATLSEATLALQSEGKVIDIVDCFRKSDSMVPVAEEAILTGAKCLWMQQGVENEEAAEIAREGGMMVIMDRCILVEHEAGNLYGVL